MLDEAEANEDEPRRALDVRILRSFKGLGDRLIATLLSDGREALDRRNLPVLRALAGVAPVTKQSGKSHFVQMRYGCSSRLRFVAYNWARVAVMHDANAKEHYATLRAKGHGHARALRGVADRLMRILIVLLSNGTCYDPNFRLRGTGPLSPPTLSSQPTKEAYPDQNAA